MELEALGNCACRWVPHFMSRGRCVGPARVILPVWKQPWVWAGQLCCPSRGAAGPTCASRAEEHACATPRGWSFPVLCT